MHSNRSFRLLVGLLVSGLIVISLVAGVAYVDWDPDDGPFSVPREELHDSAAVARQLSSRAGFDVRWPSRFPEDLQLTRARVVAAYDPFERDHPEGEWWSELQWELPGGQDSREDHPWFWVVLTQGRDLPIPEDAEAITLPATGIAAFMTSTEDQVYDSVTLWVDDGGMAFALSIRSVRDLPDDQIEHVLEAILQ